MINRLVVFGATGDLNARYLLPGLAALRAAGHLDDGFQLICADRKGRTDEEFRDWATEQLDRHAASAPADARQWVTATTRYRRADATDPADLASLIAGDGPVALYLALPPRCSPAPSPPCAAPTSLRAAGSSWRSRSVRTWTARWS
ncbi:hypothetical protein LUX73_28880 [Actinomadura madurae]|nr:hypothetical protein [Actinomadura madurae]MCQ0008313.1 hypothetical protein [Actinomadura madurae]